MSKSGKIAAKTFHQINNTDPYSLNYTSPPTSTSSTTITTPSRLTALITVLITGEQINKAYRK